MHDGTRYYDVLIIVTRDDGSDNRDADETARENKDTIVQKLDLLGARNIAAAESLSFVTASIPVAKVPGISLYDEVYAMGDGETPVTLEIDTTKETVHATPNEIRTAAGTSLDGRGVAVAVIDSGVNHNTAFNNRITDRVECSSGMCSPATAASVVGFNNGAVSSAFPSHGTQIAQVIAASGLPAHNGIAPGVNLLDASIGRHSLDSQNKHVFVKTHARDVVHALDWSFNNGADIANMSFGFGICRASHANTISLITNEAVDKGMVAVSAAGNRGILYENGIARGAAFQSITHPGCGHNEITVGVIKSNADGTPAIASYSGRGPAPGTVLLKPELVAPTAAIQVLSSVAATDTFIRGGSSFAASEVSAVTALMLQLKPEMTPVELKTALFLGANWTGPIPCTSAQYEQVNSNDNCSHARQPADRNIANNEASSLQILNNVGFGILDAAESLRYVNNAPSHIISDRLVSNTDTKQYWFTVQDTSKPVKVILSWLVHPHGSIDGQLSRTHIPVPIANLDFTVTSPDNTIIRATSDHQTNEFAVFNPTRTGTYTITVSGSNIDSINKPVQDFALASTNPIMLTPPSPPPPDNQPPPPDNQPPPPDNQPPPPDNQPPPPDNQPPPPPPPPPNNQPPPIPTTISEDFRTFSNWTQSGDSNWTIRPPSTTVPGSQSGNTVAYASNCDRTCTITLSPVDLSSRQSGHLTFDRFVGSGLDYGEYLKVQLYDGRTWDTIFDWQASARDDDNTWHTESYDLSSEYLIDDLQVRITARSSTSGEITMIDNMSIQNTASVANVVVFSDDFEGGTLNKWIRTNEPDWRADRFDERQLPPGHPSSNKVAEADNCDSLCTITMSQSINISNLQNPTLEFWRYVDESLDRYNDGDGEYLKVEVTTNGNTWRQLDIWTDENGDNDDTWHAESYDLSAYKSDVFNVRFTASMSSFNEEVGIDDVLIKATSGTSTLSPVLVDSDSDGLLDSADDCPQEAGLAQLKGCPDTTPPVITVPDDIVSKIRAGIVKYIEFRVTAVDNVDGIVEPSCNHDTGFFPLGVTQVTCTARDAANNSSIERFTITINPRSGPTNPDADGDGYPDSIDNCPNEASATNRGCPEAPQPDCSSDGPSGQIGGLCSIFETPPTIEFYGGDTYNLVTSNEDGKIYWNLGTITIGATNTTGFDGFVTAGHTVLLKPGDTFVEHRINNTSNDKVIHREPILVYYGGSVDAAFMPITEPNVVVGSKVQAMNGTVIDVTQGTLAEVPHWSILTIYGHQSNGDGRLWYKNATVTQGNTVFKNMGIALYPGIEGDSGGAIVHHIDGSSKIVGVHQGGACVFESLSEGQPLLTLEDNSVFCSKDQFYYKTFSAWENVKAVLSLR